MRLAICGLTAILLSGCSGLGMGSGGAGGYGQSGSMYGANCYSGSSGGYNFQSTGYQGAAGNGCGGAGGYGVATAGYGGAGAGYGAGGYGAAGAGYGAGGYGAAGAGYGAGGYGGATAGYGGAGAGYGAGGYGGATAGYGGAGAGYGAGGYGGATAGYGGAGAGYGASGYGGATTLGANAPYGAALGGTAIGGTGGQYTSVGGSQYAGGSYQTVQGAPIYVPQPYAVPVGGGFQGGYQGGGGFGGALPFALIGGIGTELTIGGDIFPGEIAKSNGTRSVSELTPISYKDAFKNGLSYDLGAELDLNHNTTVLARAGYTKATGADRQKIGTVTEGGVTEDLYAQFTDMKQYKIEGGLRKYMSAPNHRGGFRPYVGATGGFVYTDDVDVIQSSDTIVVDPAVNTQNYLDGGWAPTAAGLVGAEWQVGPTTALSFETGLRWTDNQDTNFKSDDRWSVPVQLRGRVAF